MSSPSAPNHDRPLATIVAEIKEETKHFVQTRVRIFKEEMHKKLPRITKALPLVAIGILLLATGWLLLTAALVAFLAEVLAPSTYAWTFSLLMVGVAWTVISLILLFAGMRMANPRLLVPEKTIEVLKGDKLWLEKESGGRA